MPSAGLAPMSRQKTARIQAADNGFIVSLDHTTDYEADFKIAKDGEEVAAIINAYFAKE
jgi:hypothetical protein